MPSSTVGQFAESDEYAANALANVSLTVVGRGRFAAKLTRLNLHTLQMARYSEDLPRVVRAAPVAGIAFITFRTRPGPGLSWDRLEMQPASIIRHSDKHATLQRSSGAARFGSMSLPRDKMITVAASLAGCDLTPPRDQLNCTPRPAAMAKLLRLHAAAGDLAEQAPEVVANPGAALGLEQALVEAMVACLDTGDVAEDRAALRRHALIMRRFHAAIEQRPEQAVYIPDVCTAVGVPQRTLNACCQEALGVGAKRYLLLRRMHLARRALRGAGAATTTITDVATRFGFWNFGRFAVEYRRQFGESPSATLLRAP